MKIIDTLFGIGSGPERTFWATAKEYFKFNGKEIRDLLITIIMLAFAFSFNKWGDETFNLAIGIKNFINAVILVGLSMLARESMKKLFALKRGFNYEYKAWFFGLIASLILAFLTNGTLMLFFVGSMIVYNLEGHRLGHFRYGLNPRDFSHIAIGGLLGNLILVLFFKSMLGIFPGNELIRTAMNLNMLFVIFNILPIPPMDGFYILYNSRMYYAFWLSFFIITCLLSYVFGWIFSIIAALILAAVLAVVYYISLEKNI